MFFSNPESDRIFERTLLRLEFQTLAGFSLKAGAKISTFLAFLQTFHNFFSIFYTRKSNRQIISEVSE
ncbi:hypothetical protein B5F90_02050 [Alistipes sp. An31A]|nr:hypothetical protein B5F90_02050 [Alistipes sp. An31A]